MPICFSRSRRDFVFNFIDHKYAFFCSLDTSTEAMRENVNISDGARSPSTMALLNKETKSYLVLISPNFKCNLFDVGPGSF